MASTIAAVTTSGGGVVTTADASGNLNLLAGTTTVVALTTAGAAVSGTLSATGITTVAAGTAALPAIISTTGTADTGLWFPAADTVAASTAGTERLRIDSSGNVTLQNNISVGGAAPTTSGTGITFPATQSASTNANTLDDYEEGTWTPSGIGCTFSSSSGKYTKIGRCVYLQFSAVWPVTGSGNEAGMSGFPFAGEGATYGFTVGRTTYAAAALNLAMPGYLGTLSGLLIYAAAGGATVSDSALSLSTISGSGYYFV